MAPSIAVIKTADASPVVSGGTIGFTVSVTNSFARGATLNDPLPAGSGLNWSLLPAYPGPGTCAISGTGPAAQTLVCQFGDLGAAPPPSSATST